MVRVGLARGVNGDTADGEIDDYRQNWWCAAKLPDGGWKSPAFLSAAERALATAEQKALADAGGGPGYLAKATMDWARLHPGDERVPEALSLAVKSSRISCTDARSEAPVSAAFRLLHSRYGNSSWAKETPYWYK